MFRFAFAYILFAATVAFANSSDVGAGARSFCVSGLSDESYARLWNRPYGQLGEFDDIRWKGMWRPATRPRLEYLRNLYMLTGGATFGNNYSSIRQATLADIQGNAWTNDEPGALENRRKLHRRTFEEWNLPSRSEAKPLEKKLEAFGYKGFSPLFYFTSGAGNWRRGAKLVKALVPLNIKEVLDAEEWEGLAAMTRFLLAGVDKRHQLVGEARAGGKKYASFLNVIDTESTENRLRGLITKARRKGNAINPLEAKLAQVAVLSAITRQYVHFDIWTSRATHAEIRGALLEFRRNYLDKVFFEDPEMNQFVHEAISRYFAAGQALGESHLFGYQDEVFAMSANPHNPRFLNDEDLNGEGAGVAYEVLRKTGRLAQLELRGVRHWMFQNIEVLSMDLLAQYGAYLQLKLPVGVVVVPERDGFKGGKPYVVTVNGGEEMIQLIEGTGLPEDLKKSLPGSYFNSNTFFMSVRLHDPIGMDFEAKPGRNRSVIILPKMSLAFTTHTNRTGLIRGELMMDYQNFKDIEGDYGTLGPQILELFRESLRESRRDLRPVFTGQF